MTNREQMRERLEGVHSFPGSYTFKVIGANSPSFVSRVVQVVVSLAGRRAEPEVSTRSSSGGKHLSVTLTVEVRDADVVLDIYEAYQGLKGVRFIL